MITCVLRFQPRKLRFELTGGYTGVYLPTLLRAVAIAIATVHGIMLDIAAINYA